MTPNEPTPLTEEEEARLRVYLSEPETFGIEARQWLASCLATLDRERATPPAGADLRARAVEAFASDGIAAAAKVWPKGVAFVSSLAVEATPPAGADLRAALEPARYWQLALAKSIDGLVTGDPWEAAAAIKGRLDSRGVVLAVDAAKRDALGDQEDAT